MLPVYNALKEAGVKCWISKYDIPFGGAHYKYTFPAIEPCKIFIVFVSVNSDTSPWVPDEVEEAKSKSKRIIPVWLENVEIVNLYHLIKNNQRFEAYEREKEDYIPRLIRFVKSLLPNKDNTLPVVISEAKAPIPSPIKVTGKVNSPVARDIPTTRPITDKAILSASAANKRLKEALLSQGRYKPRIILDAIRGGATDFSFKSQKGETALHWAAMKDDAEAVKIALAEGADPNANNNSQQTPLDLARENGFKEVIALLANAQLQAALLLGQGRSQGESKSEKILRIVRSGATDFSLTDQAGRTALHWAAMKDDVQAARIALTSGADANAVSGAKQTPLDLAKASSATKVAALLGALATAATPKVEPLKEQIQPAPTKKYDVFIVCSHLNEFFGEQIQSAFKRSGLNVYLWLDNTSVAAKGADLNDSRLTLLVASSPSLNSSGVQNAIEVAQKVGLPFIAAQIGNLKARPNWSDKAIWVDSIKEQSDANLSAIVAAVQAKLNEIDVASTQQPSSVGEGGNWYSVNGVEKLRSKKASEVMANALRELSQLAPQFLGNVEKQVLERKGNRVQKRRWLARTKEELYTNPEFHNHSVEIVPGWWLGTNYSNDNKREMLEVAREVASKLGITFDFYLA